MMGELNVGDKAIRRDLKTFLDAGFPLEEIVQDHGRKAWRINPEKNRAGAELCLRRGPCVVLGPTFPGPPGWHPLLAGVAEVAFRKLRAMLGDGALRYIESLAPAFHQTNVGAGDYTQKADIIDALMVGIEDRKAVFVTYQSAPGHGAGDLRPLPVRPGVSPWLAVLGRPLPEHTRSGTGRWIGSKVAEVTEFPFQRPKDFDLERTLGRCLRGVRRRRRRVREGAIFAGGGPIRHGIEVARQPSLTRQKDGVCAGRVPVVDDRSEIKLPRITSFGQHAMVLEPGALRQEICNEFQACLGDPRN